MVLTPAMQWHGSLSNARASDPFPRVAAVKADLRVTVSDDLSFGARPLGRARLPLRHAAPL